MSSKIIVVSTRPPTAPLSGGMAPAVARACEEFDDVTWYAVGTITTKDFNAAAQDTPNPGKVKETKVEHINVKQIIVDAKSWDEHYNRFTNSFMWPLCHDRIDLAITPQSSDYNGNLIVNNQLAEAIAKDLGDDKTTPIWVHDYHHFEMAACLRKAGVENPIAFFNHIPMPDPENLGRIKPESAAQFKMNLEGLAFCNAVNFQTAKDAHRYMRIVGIDNPPQLDPYESVSVSVPVNGHFQELLVGHYPISIDTKAIMAKATGELKTDVAKELSEQMKAPYVFVNFERRDYSKGIIPRLLAYVELMDKHPHLTGKVQMVVGAEATRPDIDAYKNYDISAKQLVDRINDNKDWWHEGHPPIILADHVNHADLVKLFRPQCEGQRIIGAVTAPTDGKNLVAKEFSASQDPDNAGVLILSGGTGSAADLGLNGKGATIYNPIVKNFSGSIDEMSAPILQAMVEAIKMPQDEANARCKAQQKHLEEYDLPKWAHEHGQLLKFLASNNLELDIAPPSFNRGQNPPAPL